MASFPQHTNREGDPQLHVHNAIANRAQRADGEDDKWRALHGQPLFRMKLGFAAYGDRFLEQELQQLGWRTVRRADGNSFEIAGISEEAADAYSDRAKELRDRFRELEAQYVRDHGHAPAKQARWALKQRAALETRNAKEHNPPAPGRELDAWTRKAERRGAGKLSALHEAAAARATERRPRALPDEAERARAIRVAVAEVQRQNAVWNRAQLTFELGRALPSLPPDADPETYLDELAIEALSGRAEGVTVLQIAPVPDVIDVSRLGFRKDGTSIYRPPDEALFCTSEHLDHEQWLVDVAVLPVRQRVSPGAAAAALAGTDLDYSQREAALGLLTSARLINSLVAPAGTGKTHTMAAFARIWEEQHAGRVIGLTASTNAARVMADEAAQAGARMECFNIAQFLGKIKDSDQTRGHVPVYPGDVLIVDEATQVSTEDALRIAQVARQCGAMVVGTFDPEQLGAVDAGGIFPLIAARHGSYRLTEVRRFRSAWEREASLKLRDGDIAALAEYATRGRIYHGPQDRVYDDAVTLWVTDYLQGKDALLLAASNEEAARLARLVRERLTELHKISGANEITLADGNQAGTGDLVRARLNTRIDADGQTLANRDTIRIDGWHDGAFGRQARVSRRTGPGQWSRPFFVPAAYLEQNAELDYAGNVPVEAAASTPAAWWPQGMTRDLLYTGSTRGRKERHPRGDGAPDPAQPSRAEREAYADAGLKKAHELARQAIMQPRTRCRCGCRTGPATRQDGAVEAVLAQAMQRSTPRERPGGHAGRPGLRDSHRPPLGTRRGVLAAGHRAEDRRDGPRSGSLRPSTNATGAIRSGPHSCRSSGHTRSADAGSRTCSTRSPPSRSAARSIAAVLHSRAEKSRPGAGQTAGWAERAPRTLRPRRSSQRTDARRPPGHPRERLAVRPPHGR